MQEIVEVTGMVLSQTAVAEYDKRVVILTKERGKITVFAKGARKPNSRFSAATDLFAFGQFKLYEGRSAYNLCDVSITNYFETMREDYQAALYGMFFLEVMDYYTRENNDEVEMLKLLYQSLRALQSKSLSKQLVSCIFQCKTLVIQGEFPGIPGEKEYDQSTEYTIHYIVNSSVEKLYTFTVSDIVLEELQKLCEYYRKRFIGHTFKSLELLELMG